MKALVSEVYEEGKINRLKLEAPNMAKMCKLASRAVKKEEKLKMVVITKVEEN